MNDQGVSSLAVRGIFCPAATNVKQTFHLPDMYSWH